MSKRVVVYKIERGRLDAVGYGWMFKFYLHYTFNGEHRTTYRRASDELGAFIALQKDWGSHNYEVILGGEEDAP